jgi:hypothetical protein
VVNERVLSKVTEVFVSKKQVKEVARMGLKLSDSLIMLFGKRNVTQH